MLYHLHLWLRAITPSEPRLAPSSTRTFVCPSPARLNYYYLVSRKRGHTAHLGFHCSCSVELTLSSFAYHAPHRPVLPSSRLPCIPNTSAAPTCVPVLTSAVRSRSCSPVLVPRYKNLGPSARSPSYTASIPPCQSARHWSPSLTPPNIFTPKEKTLRFCHVRAGGMPIAG